MYIVLTSGLVTGFEVEPLEGQREGGQQKVVVDVESVLDVVVNWNDVVHEKTENLRSPNLESLHQLRGLQNFWLTCLSPQKANCEK